MEAKTLIGGLLAGAAIGVAIGILMAPDTGENTRASIAKGTRKLTDGLKGTLGESVDSLKNLITSGVDDAVKKGREVMPRGNDKATV